MKRTNCVDFLLNELMINREQLENNIKNPNWNKKSRVHDWINYIDSHIQKTWNDIPIEARYIFVLLAMEKANKEEWD